MPPSAAPDPTGRRGRARRERTQDSNDEIQPDDAQYDNSNLEPDYPDSDDDETVRTNHPRKPSWVEESIKRNITGFIIESFAMLTSRTYGDHLDVSRYKILCICALKDVEDKARRRFANEPISIRDLDRGFYDETVGKPTEFLQELMPGIKHDIADLNNARRRLYQLQKAGMTSRSLFHNQAALTKAKNRQRIVQWFLNRRVARGIADPPPVVEQAQAAVVEMQAEVAALQEAEHAEPDADLQHDLQELAAAFESLEASHPEESHSELLRELDEFQAHMQQAQSHDMERRELLAALQHGLDETNGLLDELLANRALQVQRQGPVLYKAWRAATRAECSPPA